MKKVRKIIKIASNYSIIRKAILTSIIVGTILNLINQGNLIFTNQIAEVSITKMSITYLTPFMVSLYSTTTALLRKDLLLLTEN
ncbi:nitrate/nitrite transporter NrtS [Paradesertivirga mongoliensis]|uniref:Nitrate/nitrite transporter NrtS n=1 Tax=Paradesertivirga mongoliensis TaxID=2100740 RepID=A0ABW4ZNM8_9SPHI